MSDSTNQRSIYAHIVATGLVCATGGALCAYYHFVVNSSKPKSQPRIHTYESADSAEASSTIVETPRMNTLMHATSEVDSLKSQRLDLKRELEASRVATSELEAENGKQAAQLQVLHRDVLAMKESDSVMNQQFSALQNQYEKLIQSQVPSIEESLKGSMAERDRSLAESNQVLIASQYKAENMEAKLFESENALTANLGDAKLLISSLQVQLVEANCKVQTLQAQMDDLTSTNNSIAEELSGAKTQVVSLTKSLNDSVQRQKGLESVSEELVARLGGQTKLLTNSKVTISELEALVSKYELKVKSHSSEIIELSFQLESMQSSEIELARSKDDLLRSYNQMETTLNELTNLQETLDKNVDELSESNRIIDDLESKLQREIEDHGATKCRLSEIESLKLETDSYREENSTLRMQLDNGFRREKALKSVVDELTARLGTETSHIEENASFINNLEMELNVARKSQAESINQNDILRSRFDDMSHLIIKQDREIELLTIELDNAQLSPQPDSTERQLEEELSRSKANNLADELENLKVSHTDTTNKLDEMQSERDSLIEENEELRELTADAVLLRAEVEEKNVSMAKLREANEIVNSAIMEIEGALSEFRELKPANGDLELEYQCVSNTTSSVTSEVSEMETRAVSLAAEIQRLGTENLKLKSVFNGAIDDFYTESETSAKHLATLLNLQMDFGNFSESASAYQAKLHGLELDNLNAHSESKSNEIHRERTLSELESFRGDYSFLSDNIHRLQKELSLEKEQSGAELSLLRAEVAALTKDLNTAGVTIAELETKNKAIVGFIKSLKDPESKNE